MMSTQLPRNVSRKRGAVLLLASLLLNLLPAPAAAAAAAPRRPAQAGTAPFVRVLNLPVNDIVYDKQSKKLFASIPSRAGAGGNSVTEIDPATGALGASVFVGSEPNKLAVSDDGQTVYVGLDGAVAVRRVDMATHTAGVQFTLGAETFGGPFTAGDLAVVPGNPDAVAVARILPSSSPPGTGVAVYDNGVQRPNIGQSPGNNPTSIAFGATASILYGGQPFGGSLQKMSVDAAGATWTGSTSFGFPGEIQFENGLLYNDRGQVYNPATDALAGTFAGAGFGPFVVDASVGRAYFIVNAQTPTNQSVTLRAYDINTFTSVGEITVGGLAGTPTSLVRWGANGLAFRTNGNQLFLIQTSLVPSSEQVPEATPTPSPTPTPTPVNTPVTVKRIPLVTKDLVYSPSAQTIYASLPSTAGAAGNSVAQIDPLTLTVGTPVFVGSEPTKLALSEDGQFLYVGLNGASAVRRFDTATQTPGPQFFLGADNFDGPFRAAGLAVVPGSPQSVAVNKSAANSFSQSVAVYDGTAQRPNTAGVTGPDVLFGASAARLYTGGGAGVLKHNVDASGVGLGDGVRRTNGGSIRFAGGLLYTANGSVVEPETDTRKGTFTGDNLQFNSLMAVDAALGRAYFLTVTGLTGLLRVYDINTFLPIGRATFPVGFTPNGSDPFEMSSLIRWGANGLAFRTNSHVHIIQSTLVNPSGEVPTPTPTPSATPTPSPTPQAATFVRKLPLTINDFALSPTTQKIYATVPSTVGADGNSIVEIEPATGATNSSTFVGSEPARLDISDDGQVIWVSLAGAQAVRRFDVATKTPGTQFSISGSGLPTDLEVMPGSPQTVAVTSGGAPRIYDDGVARPPAPFSPRIAATAIEFGSVPSVLYGYNGGDTGFDFYRMSVSASGVALTGSARGLVGGGFGGGLRFSGGRMYTPGGRVFDPETFQPIATLQGAGTFGGGIAVDPTLRRVFIASDGLNNMVIHAYDMDTFRPLGRVTLPFGGTPTRLERWGANGLALRAFSTSSPGGGTGSLYLIQTALVSPDAPVPTGVMFAQQGAFIFEPETSIPVTVIRTGDLSAASTVEYATADGTASERGDYTTALGTLRFAPGESQKVVRVLLTNDAIQEGTETFDLTLSGATGANLVLPDRLTVTITDDDFSPNPNNPIDDPQTFVRQHYHDFLNRVPDASGLNFWTREITNCGADAQCREVKRNNVSAAFFLSIEFQRTGYLVYRLHQAAYATGETLGMRPFLKDTQEIGQGVVVGQGEWEAHLEANTRAFIARFAARPEFVARYPASLSAAEFVDALNANTGGSLTQGERDSLVAELTAGTKTRAEVLRAVAENPTFSQRHTNRAFVYMQYVGYLRRNPNATPDTDYTGYNFWLTKLNDFGGNYIAAEMVKAFITSIEYRRRFAP